jgi:cobalt/nickel transport system permease protein
MRHDFLDRYSRIDSPIHRLPAALKMGLALGAIFIVVLPPITTLYPFLFTAVVLLGVIALSRIPLSFMVRRILIFEPFIVAVAVLALLQPGGFLKFSTIVVKSTLSLVTIIVLSNTTPFTELLGVFRHLHAPPVFLTMMALMYRYVFVLVDEMQRMKRARLSRTFKNKKENARSWRSLSMMIGQLFLRSTERAERIFAAMSARGWKS